MDFTINQQTKIIKACDLKLGRYFDQAEIQAIKNIVLRNDLAIKDVNDLAGLTLRLAYGNPTFNGRVELIKDIQSILKHYANV